MYLENESIISGKISEIIYSQKLLQYSPFKNDRKIFMEYILMYGSIEGKGK